MFSDTYSVIKTIHVAAVALSGLLFIVRGYWMWCESARLSKKWVKIVPHVTDTILLVSAIALVFKLQQYPLTDAWLTAKVFMLIAYIVAGSIALKRGKTRKIKLNAFIIALVMYLYIVMVAISKNAFVGVV